MNGSRTFIDVLRDVRQGASAAELSEQMTALVAAVRNTGRPGKLTLTLVVKPASKGDVTTLMVDDQVVVKMPALDRGTTVFFSNAENILTRNDPRQPELSGLREVVTHPSARQVQEGAAQ